MKTKIEYGQYFTKTNPFMNKVFTSWFEEAIKVSDNKTILEPFVGGNDIINLLKSEFIFNYQGYDLYPCNSTTIKQDTLKNYPKGYDIAITNPPYLAKNSATRKKIKWLYKDFDDLYKVSVNEMLKYNNYVAAIIPVTILTSDLFKDRLSDYILLNMKMFEDTDNPVCLALFKPEKTNDFNIWELEYDNINLVGTYLTLRNKLNKVLEKKNDVNIRFNSKEGQYGVLAADKSYKSLKFVKGHEIPESKVKKTSRNIVRIKIDKEISIDDLNKKLDIFLMNQGEIFLAPFKNLRKDNKYRRRLDFKTIRRIIESC